MVCRNCGKDLRETAKFCPWCGEKVVPDTNGTAEISEESAPAPANEEIAEIPEENAPVPVTEEIAEIPEENDSVTANEEIAEIPEENAPTPANEEITEISEENAPVPENEETAENSPELAAKFDEKDGLFVVTAQPVSEETENTEILTEKIPDKSVRFPVKRGSAVLAAVFLTALCIAAVYFVPNRIIPFVKYQNAEKLFRNGDYISAESEFLNLGNYSDSRDYVIKCRYEAAVQMMNDGEFQGAAKAFSSLDGYSDSDALAAECLIYAAEAYLAEGSYEAAMSMYYAAGKPELAENTARTRAEALAEEEDYFAAAEAAWKYSEEAAAEYAYLGSEKAMNNGDLKTAANGFAALGEYKDSRKLAMECLYGAYISEYHANGASGETVRGFCIMGDYRDSKGMFIQSAYEYGSKLFKEENYYEAASMFRNSGTYKDSAAMLYRSRYELGKSLEESDPASAYSIFAMLGNYSDSAARKKYAASKLGESSSVWYADGFTSAGDYCTGEFGKNDFLTVYCTAGTDSPSGSVTFVLTLTDSLGSSVSADCENVRNSSSFSGSFPLSAAALGEAEITVSLKDSGEIIRRFEVTIVE